MSKSLTFLDCWMHVATGLFSQALAGAPTLVESLPKPMPAGSFGLAATLEGEDEGRFSVLLDGSLAEAALLGEGVDQKGGWAELLKEAMDAACGELLAKTGRRCQVRELVPINAQTKLSRAFQLKAGERSWLIQVNSEVRSEATGEATSKAGRETGPAGRDARPDTGQGGATQAGAAPALSPGLELLLDVELEASLRFGGREMPLAEVLSLGPGDVVQLDRHISDPVDLIIGDKIVARGEVVLVNGNFGLRVTEVAEPRRRLESIRCLF